MSNWEDAIVAETAALDEFTKGRINANSHGIFPEPVDNTKFEHESWPKDEPLENLTESKLDVYIPEGDEVGVVRKTESQFDAVFDSRPPEEIAAEIKANEEKIAFEKAKNMKPEDMAAHIYGMFLPHYLTAVSRLSLKEARRVLDGLIEYPLNVDKVDCKTEDGKNAFALGMRLLEAKNIMIASVEMDKMAATLQGRADKEKQDLEAASQPQTESVADSTGEQTEENKNGET